MSTIRSDINSLVSRKGEPEEAKLFSVIGKGLCVWLIWKHSEVLISHSDVLSILLLFLIMPDLIKRFMENRFGAGSSTTSSSQSSSTTVSSPDPKP
jgi:hypothetical protein